MYTQYFGLKKLPFSISPDPNFLYLSEGHREALAHLTYGLLNGGFVLLTGDIGTGKTTLLRNLISKDLPNLDIAFILNPKLTVKELLETLCDKLHISYPSIEHPTIKNYIDVLNNKLIESYSEGQNTVIVIDEAQNLSAAVLEQLRLLTNLETDEEKLITIILIGQPELNYSLNKRELRQLNQRITARYHLGPLSKKESDAYIKHRLAIAGGNQQIFTKSSISQIYKFSNGIPRLINILSDRSLLGAYVQRKQQVRRSFVRKAAKEISLKQSLVPTGILMALVSLFCVGFAWVYLSNSGHHLGQATDPPQKPVSRQAVSNSANEPEIKILHGVATKKQHKLLLNAINHNDKHNDSEMSYYAAYESLFTAWGIQTNPRDSADNLCGIANSGGLQCLESTGTWNSIKTLNLPAIIEINMENQETFFATILDLSEKYITVDLNGDRLTTTLAEITNYWNGNYLILWQAPPHYQGNLKYGDSHSTVRWLRYQLTGLVPRPIDSNRPTDFDSELELAVIEFQTLHNLTADGVVRPTTWIQLANQLNLPGPKLDK